MADKATDVKEYVIIRGAKIGWDKKAKKPKKVVKIGDKVKLTEKQAIAYRKNRLIS